MSVRTRLLATLVLMIVLLGGPAVYAVIRLADVRDIVVELRGRHAEALLALGRLEAELAEVDRRERSYIATGDPEMGAWIEGALVRSRELFARLEHAGYGESAREARERFAVVADSLRRIHRLVETDRRDEAVAAFEPVKDLLAGLDRSLSPVARAVGRRSDEHVRRAQELTSRTATTTALGLFVALLLAAGLAVWTMHTLTSPLHRLRSAMAAVAAGRLSAPEDLPYDHRHEMGDLSRSFRSMTERLAELDRMRAEFLSMASHDLKTAISVIHSYSEVLAQNLLGDVNERQREVLATMKEQTRLLTAAVDQLVDTGRAGSGGFPIERESVDARALFEEVRRAFTALAQRNGVAFSVAVEPSAPDSLLLDPIRVRNEVLGNLLSNAFKFTPADGRVRVRVAGAADDRITIEVSDTGPGIPPDRLPHVFERYYQARDEDRGRGAGLGLAIVRQVVRAHGGEVHATSEPGQGTTFRIVLPVGAPAEAGEAVRA